MRTGSDPRGGGISGVGYASCQDSPARLAQLIPVDASCDQCQGSVTPIANAVGRLGRAACLTNASGGTVETYAYDV